MSSIDPYSSVAELGEALRSRRVTSMELTTMYLDRLTKWGESLGAVVTITRDLAIEQARRADRETAAGKRRGPLHGVPFGVKDLLATKGIPTTWGAEPYRDQVFDYDATVVKRLADAGAVLVAKLAMVELAGGFGYDEADASLTGPGRTPWNRDFWSGGSSSGPGAAVAAALVPFAIGSETSGSIITPSAFSGVTGLRPTYGVVSRHGAMALSWTLDKLGPMCRTADDCRLVMQAIAGPDPADPTTVRPLDWRYATGSARRLRVGVVPATWAEVQPAVRENFLASLDTIRSLGHETVDVELPDFPYGPAVGVIVDAEGASAFEDLLRTGRAKMLRAPADRIGGYAMASTLATDYLRAMRIRPKARAALLDLFRKVDCLAAPARSTVAYPIGPKFRDAYPGIRTGPSMIPAMNLAGAPGISLPNGFGDGSLPTAIQINAAPMSDALLLDLGAQIQSKTRYHLMKPPIE